MKKRIPDLTIHARIEALPQWAQLHIADLARQRETAVNELNRFMNTQKQTDVWVTSFICDTVGGPTIRKHYIDTDKIEILHAGIYMRIALSGHHKNCIDVQYSSKQWGLGDVVLQPQAYQQFILKLPKTEEVP